MAIIDLHVHSNYSDGELTPYEIIDEAVKNGVKYLAIADHDTIDSYTDDLFLYAEKRGIILNKAVEISTKSDTCGIHILGYKKHLPIEG